MDDLTKAFSAFARSCEHVAGRGMALRARPFGFAPAAWERICLGAVRYREGIHDEAQARQFFETHFRPYRISAPSHKSHFTAYFEPQVRGRRDRSDCFRVPLLKPPCNLVSFEKRARPASIASHLMRGCENHDGSFTACPDRQAIESGALAGQDLELVWLDDPVAAYFIHIQGSARVVLPDATLMRLTYADKNGYPYTSIGKAMVAKGLLPGDNVTLESIQAWLRAHPKQRDNVLWQNRSYIFFRHVRGLDPDLGPRAAAGIQLTPKRSIAVDRRLFGFHIPFWIAADLPGGSAFGHSRQVRVPFNRLMIAQDTGSAIVGSRRADLFLGAGEAIGRHAGRINHYGDMIMFRPPGPARITVVC